MGDQLQDFSHVIQLSVAPVFLLTSVGTILSVLSSRLGRIVDRARVLRDRITAATPDVARSMKAELATLRVRRRLVNHAITFGTVTAILVCMLIVLAFVGYILQFRIGVVAALLFSLAMVFFIAALVMFLREVLLASRPTHFEIE